jgi:hypothetical protein
VSFLDVDRLTRLVGELSAFARRRRESREPRVRVRIAHGEARVLREGDAARERMLPLARDLVDEYGVPERGQG